MILSHEDRATFRSSLKQLSDLTTRVETVANGSKEMTPILAKNLHKLTGSHDLHTQFQALTATREELEGQYMELLKAAAPHDLTAFAEYLNPEQPPAPHHVFLCELLHKFASRELERGLISMPPGHAKPLSIDTPVMMGDGVWKPLGDVQIGETVITKEGRPREVLEVHEQGVMTTVRITTESDRVIYAEPSHPFLTPAGWVEAGDLSKNDRLTLIKDYEIPDSSGRSHAEFVLAGYVMAMGFVRNRVNARLVTIDDRFRTDDKAIFDHFTQVAGTLGFLVTPDRLRYKEDFVWTGLLCESFQAWLKEVGLWGASRDDLHAPDFVFKGDFRRICGFLGAVVSMDANMVPTRNLSSNLTRKMEVVSRSDRMFVDLQRLLLRVGVRSRLGRRFHRKFRKGVMAFWYLSIERGQDIHAMQRSLPIMGKSKTLWEMTVAVEEYDHPLYMTDRIVSVEEHDERHEMRCLTVEEDASFLANGAVVHNSTYSTHLFPAWILGKQPNLRYLQAGHTQQFAENEFSKKVRGYINSDRYGHIFPETVVDNDDKAIANWSLAGKRGRYVVRGVGQGIAGIRGDFAGVDDPFKSREDAQSQLVRDKVYAWLWTDFISRLLPGSPLFVVATRWHMDDVIGRLEQKSKDGEIEHFEVINLPAVCVDGENDPMGRKEGEPLWPDLFTLDYLMRLKAGFDPRDWEALYQGNPVPSEGRMIKDEWLLRYDQLPSKNMRNDKDGVLKRVTISVDAANKAKKRNDFSVITVWYESASRKHYLAEVIRKRLQFPELITTIEDVATKHNANAILVEDAGSGTQYIQLRTGLAPAPIIPIQVSNKSKEFRFDAVLPMFQGQEVLVPENAPWLGEYLNELLLFPDGKNDDQVDSTSQYLYWARFKRNRGTKKAVGA